MKTEYIVSITSQSTQRYVFPDIFLQHQIGIPHEDSDTTDEGQDGDELDLPDYSDDDKDRLRRVRCVRAGKSYFQCLFCFSE